MFGISILSNLLGEDEEEENVEDMFENTGTLDDVMEEEDENRLDEIEKRVDDISTQSDSFESEVKRLEDRVSGLEDRLDGIDERTSSMMKMYDDFAAGVNPLAKTGEKEEETSIEFENQIDGLPEEGNEEDKNTRSVDDENTEERTEKETENQSESSMVKERLDVADGCYPVHSVEDYQPILNTLNVLEDERRVETVLNRLVDDRFITNTLAHDIEEELRERKEFVIQDSDKEGNGRRMNIDESSMYRFYEKLILVIAENATEP